MSEPTKTLDEALQSFETSFTNPDWDTLLLELMAEDAVMESPFAPPGRPGKVTGKHEIAAYFLELKKVIRLDEVRIVTTYKTDDPNVVILQAEGRGRAIHTGKPFEPRYAEILTFRYGLLVRWQDYWSPLAFLVAIGAISMPDAEASRFFSYNRRFWRTDAFIGAEHAAFATGLGSTVYRRHGLLHD